MPQPDPIRAELVGSNQADAEGHRAQVSSPVLALCRRLVANGFDPDRPLHAYRGNTLCLTIRSIGEGARLEVNGQGNGFRPYCGAGAAPPMSQINPPIHCRASSLPSDPTRPRWQRPLDCSNCFISRPAYLGRHSEEIR